SLHPTWSLDELKQAQAGATESLRSLTPFVRGSDLPRQRPPKSDTGELPSPETLARWLATVLRLQQTAAGSPEFYREAAQTLVELVGLDVGLVLTRQDNTWNVVGSHAGDDTASARFSRTILNQVATERLTVYQDMAAL